VRFDGGGTYQVTLADRHAAIAELNLCNTVPDDVTIQFDTARNLLLYSWHAYRFIPVAELQAYRTVEMALRMRFGLGQNAGPGLRRLLKRAVAEGLLKDEGFRQQRRTREWQQEYREAMQQFGSGRAPFALPADVQAYARQIADAMPVLRNNLAHGGSTLHAGGILTLEICCDLINQLFC
jgi:hypothetical protein